MLFACDVLSSSPYFPCVALYNDSLTRLWSAQVSGTVDKVNRETWRLNALNAWGINIFYCPAHATCPPTTGVLNSELVSAIHFAEANIKCARAAFICYLNSEWVCFIFLQGLAIHVRSSNLRWQPIKYGWSCVNCVLFCILKMWQTIFIQPSPQPFLNEPLLMAITKTSSSYETPQLLITAWQVCLLQLVGV